MKKIIAFIFLWMISGQVFSQDLMKTIKDNYEGNRNREERISKLMDQKIAGTENRSTWISEFCIESEVFMNTELVGYTLSQSPLLNKHEKAEAQKYFPNFPPRLNADIEKKMKAIDQLFPEKTEAIFDDFMQTFLSNYLLKIVGSPDKLSEILNDKSLSVIEKKQKAEMEFAETFASYTSYKEFSPNYQNNYGNLMKDDFEKKWIETEMMYKKIMNLK